MSHFTYFLKFPQKTLKNIFATTSRHVTLHIRRRENTKTPIQRYFSGRKTNAPSVCAREPVNGCIVFVRWFATYIAPVAFDIRREFGSFFFHSQSSEEQACFYRLAFRISSVENAVMRYWFLSWIAKQTVVFRRSALEKPTNGKAKTRDVSLSGHWKQSTNPSEAVTAERHDTYA